MKFRGFSKVGRVGVEFKVNAAIGQCKLLQNPPRRGGRGRSGANR